FQSQTGMCYKRTGATILVTSACNILCFILAAIIPIPAMRTFCLQVSQPVHSSSSCL
ncbi:hypothetical protein HELRODRAFT_70706, partial [Helobdella robusta]|uniref:SSD domain-containing protein n=1 Tax=Helobdella robusta TaxID=6412 RepID=T1G0A9_HELRO